MVILFNRSKVNDMAKVFIAYDLPLGTVWLRGVFYFKNLSKIHLIFLHPKK